MPGNPNPANRFGAPNRHCRSSSYGYTLLAAALEETTSEAFDKLVSEVVQEGYGLPSIHAESQDSFSADRPYARVFDGRKLARPRDLSYKWAAGGMRTNVMDLARFAWLFSLDR